MHNKNLSKGAHAETPQVRHPERDFITGLQRSTLVNMQPDPLPPFQICLSLTSAELGKSQESLEGLNSEKSESEINIH